LVIVGFFGFRTRDIADAITETGVEIAIHLHPDVDTSIKVVVIAEA
jgi:ribosomal protein L9